MITTGGRIFVVAPATSASAAEDQAGTSRRHAVTAAGLNIGNTITAIC